jgi:hypothetical protein
MGRAVNSKGSLSTDPWSRHTLSTIEVLPASHGTSSQRLKESVFLSIMDSRIQKSAVN